jgi:predicted small secreted protein
MKDRIRKLAAIALSLAVAFIAAACNNGSGSGY